MIVYIALCGSTGTINRVIHSTPLGIINEGSDIRELFTGENELDSPAGLRDRTVLPGHNENGRKSNRICYGYGYEPAKACPGI